MLFSLLTSSSPYFPFNPFPPLLNLLYLLLDSILWCMYHLSWNKAAYINKYIHASKWVFPNAKRCFFLLWTLRFTSLLIPLTNAPFINREIVSFSPLNHLNFQIK